MQPHLNASDGRFAADLGEKISTLLARDSARMNKSPPFFAEQLSDVVGTARAYGIGKSIGEIAAAHTREVSLSTLKAVSAGRHIRPEQLRVIGHLFRMRPLDWIETKIRYVEAHMAEYLVGPSETNAQDRIDAKLVASFFELRHERINAFHPHGSHEARLQVEVRKAFLAAKTTPAKIGATNGPASSKKDKSRMSYPTVTAFCRGEHVRPEKLQAICRHLHLPRTKLTALKISYAEAFLDEFLLGHDHSVFQKARSLINYPRTVTLLIFSTENLQELA